MPLSINVGLSRKASRDFQSTGVSINLTAELDQSLLSRPDDLQQQIGNLYDQARQALARQTHTSSTARTSRAPGPSAPNGDGQMTASQRRAIDAIARRSGIDPAAEARRLLGLELEELGIRQASQLIDHLNQLAAPAGRNGGGR
jgi:CO/xanthine dehydrogenase Mo-binding subunit